MGFVWFLRNPMYCSQWPWPVAGGRSAHPFFWLWERLQCTPTLAAEISTLEFQCNSYFPTQNGPVDRVPGFLPLSGGGPWWLQARGSLPFLLNVRLFLLTHSEPDIQNLFFTGMIFSAKREFVHCTCIYIPDILHLCSEIMLLLVHGCSHIAPP